MAELQVTVNPYHRSVSINGEEVIQRIIPFPDWFNSLASITCDYDDVMKTITDVANVHRYVSHYVEKQYYFKHLPDYIDWFYKEKQAQENYLAEKKAKWDELLAQLAALGIRIDGLESKIENIENLDQRIEVIEQQIIEIKQLITNLQEIIQNGGLEGIELDFSEITITVPDTTEPRKLKDRFGDIINVKDYGAVGDGVTDDSEAFNKAIEAAKEKDALIYIPVGNFVVDKLPDIPCYGSGNIIVHNPEDDTDKKYRAFELLLKYLKVGIGTGSSTVILDEPIDYNDKEQLEELERNLPTGQLVAHPCCSNCPDELISDVVINGSLNTREVIVESCEWEAPVTGWYKITCVGGGEGAHIWKTTNYFSQAQGGAGGEIKTVLRYFTKGQQIPVVIGAGGQPGIVSSAGWDPLIAGGETTFADVVAIAAASPVSYSPLLVGVSEMFMSSIGGKGTDNFAKHIPTYASLVKSDGLNYHVESADAGAYGGGGSLNIGYRGATSVSNATDDKLWWAMGAGKQGCVIVEYHDASKDKSVSIDMASSITINDLQQQIAVLAAKIQELETNG